jgi:hypothetical protein
VKIKWYKVILMDNFKEMSKEEIKYEINKVLDMLPDTALEQLLLYLKQQDAKDISEARIKEILKQIIDEDADLLLRLAQ